MFVVGHRNGKPKLKTNNGFFLIFTKWEHQQRRGGQGQPGIMYARGTLVDSQYQWDSNANAGDDGGTLEPNKRKVTQNDIDMLGLEKLKFDSNGKANLGTINSN